MTAPRPIKDENGLPLCSEDKCGLFDGKRCRAMGFRPDRFCEPALIEMRERLDALTRTDPDSAALARRPDQECR